MGALDGMSGEIKTKTEKETNNIEGKEQKKRGRKAENPTYYYSNKAVLRKQRRMDRRTDGPTDQPTKRLIELRARD